MDDEREFSMSRFSGVIAMAGICLVPLLVSAQPRGFNYDESKVPSFELPRSLLTNGGELVDSARQWQRVRRPEIMTLFEDEMYGRTPASATVDRFELISSQVGALDGTAVRKQIRAHFTKQDDGPGMDILIYLPPSRRPAPIFLGLNFSGNHTVNADPAIRLTDSWVREKDNRATERDRGWKSSRWAIDSMLERGYGLATIYYGDIDPDFHDEFKNGVHALNYRQGQQMPDPDQWGSIGAWAWGLSRALDYCETDRDIDHNKVAVMGHSRLGKTSLWAGAQDERFALVISNNSGCGGAALSRRRFGETVERINTSFPHWFCGNFKKYNGKEDQLPLDQHMLIALMAPRPVYVASAVGDSWADPRGEFLSCMHAVDVYRLLGRPGLGTEKMPRENSSVGETLGYHVRAGKHDVTEYDWQRYMDFADKHFR